MTISTTPTVLTNPDTMCLRQVHPQEVTASGLSSSAFLPNTNDNGLLSTRHESMGAKAAFQAWISAGYQSVGTWGFTVGEISSLSKAVAIDDAAQLGVLYHVSVDFNNAVSEGEKKRWARKFRDAAESRGRLHPYP